ncbi:unnamed protein product [Merluccius merluccius]
MRVWTTSHLFKQQVSDQYVIVEAFDLVLRHGRNSSLVMLRSEFPALVPGAQGSVAQLFLDMSLYILGSDSTVDHMVSTFFGRLFPLAYRRLLGGGASSGSEECLRGAWKESAAFGPYPKLMMTRLSRSLLATRVFLQALNLGIEVVNTTNHLRPNRDCGRSLLRLWYCPQCRALLGVPVCRGFCQAVMQGCLGGAAEVQPHWRTYVDGLGKLAGGMRGEQDMEAVVLRLTSMVKLALKHAVNARGRLTSVVGGICGSAAKRASRSAPAPLPPPVVRRTPPATPDPDETLASLRREFISSLRGFGFFYSGLGEALCSREPAPGNHSLCWNGQEMTDRFPGPGLKRTHPHGSESRNNKVPEPVISQIIDKLKHINQLLRLVTVSEKRWRARSRGDGGEERGGEEVDEDGFQSGDCDDEDEECAGVSGLGPPPRRKRLRIFSDLADNLPMDDLNFHEQLLTPHLATAGVGGFSSASSTPSRWSLVLVLLLTLSLFLIGYH